MTYMLPDPWNNKTTKRDKARGSALYCLRMFDAMYIDANPIDMF